MPAQYIYTMRDLRRFYPPDREVLAGINISMFPGAKIGVLGANGSGKSSLLRIMAGDGGGDSGAGPPPPAGRGRYPPPPAPPPPPPEGVGHQAGRVRAG